MIRIARRIEIIWLNKANLLWRVKDYERESERIYKVANQ